jgi:hypothetical protein
MGNPERREQAHAGRRASSGLFLLTGPKRRNAADFLVNVSISKTRTVTLDPNATLDLRRREGRLSGLIRHSHHSIYAYDFLCYLPPKLLLSNPAAGEWQNARGAFTKAPRSKMK